MDGFKRGERSPSALITVEIGRRDLIASIREQAGNRVRPQRAALRSTSGADQEPPGLPFDTGKCRVGADFGPGPTQETTW
jgi:hypothetical protein